MAPLRSVLGRAKRTAFRAGRRLRCALSPHAVCLIYHRIADLEIDTQLLAVSRARFREHLLHLKALYLPLAPAELHAHMAAGRIPPRAVVVTFDDGYADNLLNMLPIAEEVGVPVTIFVSTGLLGTDREFWWDELERLFLTGRRLPPRLRLPWGEETLDWPTDSSASIRKAYDGMHTLIKALIPEERESRLSALRAWAGANAAGRPSHRSLTHEELVSLARSPLVTIGAHTRSHTALSALSPERQRDEISGSKRELEALLSSEVPIFSYPFGEKRDYTRITPGLCREAGFQAAYSNFYGQIFAPTDRFQIPRALVRNWSVEEFAKRMRGFFRA